jgi:hypothetical protein
MGKGDRLVRSGEIRVRIGRPISTEGTTIRERNRLMKEAWEAIYILKGETDEVTEGPVLAPVRPDSAGEAGGAARQEGGEPGEDLGRDGTTKSW